MKRIITILISLLVFPISVYAYSNSVIPGGNTIGITVSPSGVMVVGFYKVNGSYNKGINDSLKEGDYIYKINDLYINSTDDLINAVDMYKDNDRVKVYYKRNNTLKELELYILKEDGKAKTGLFVKDKISGIGTLSYIDPETNVYGALGHEIVESNSKVKVDVSEGSIFKNLITSIDKSRDGEPGSKNAKFYQNKVYGNVLKNTKYGIYGNYTSQIDDNNLVEVKKLSDVKLGKAYIRTVIKGEEVKDYEIEITNINNNSKLKSITFKIVDEELLDKTGGVVQGMSGSPIMQDGYLIGAVTHVLVDNVTQGYGVSIITMLSEGDKLVD